MSLLRPAPLSLGVRTHREMDGESKKGLGRWFWVAIFAALSILHAVGWYRGGEVLELIRAVGFALLIPHSWFFPAWPRSATPNSVSHARIRYFTLPLWLVGAAMVVYALARSWL